jgi:hypothetical protein
MQELIDAIKAWPIIIQGALGSALFWLVLLCGQYLTTRISRSYSLHSKVTRESWLVGERAKCMANISKTDFEFSAYAIILMYRAARHLCKALMWLAMGLVFQSLFLPAGVIGFLGCLHYLFKVAEVLGPIDDERHSASTLAKIDQELNELRNV